MVLRPDEQLKLSLHPHPLAFAKYHALVFAYFVAAVFLQQIFTLANQSTIPFVDYGELAVFWLFLIVPSIAVGLLWVSKQPLVYSFLVGVAGTILVAYFGITPVSILPGLLAGTSILAIVLIELYRRSHKYVVTDHRVILSKSFISKTSRELHYSRISDLVINQGVLGRMFNFGTIIPVSQAGMGLGEDTAGAVAGAGIARGRVVVGGGVFGSKGVSVPRSATYYSLYGVPGPETVAGVISDLIQASEEAPLLRDIRDRLAGQTSAPMVSIQPTPTPPAPVPKKERKEIEQEA